MIQWLETHQALAGWLQTFGIIAAISFGVLQIRQTKDAIKNSVTTNEIMLRENVSDLLVSINLAALDHPQAAGDFEGHKRFHLLRIHYFYRTFRIRQMNLLDDDTFQSEEAYLAMTSKFPDFREVWQDFREQYPSNFREWVDNTLRNSEGNSAENLR